MAVMPRITVHVDVFLDDTQVELRGPRLLWDVIGPVSEQRLLGPTLGERKMLQLTDTQQVQISIAPEDKKGGAAPVQGVTFASSDTAVAAVTQDAADPLKALVVAGQPGTCQITVTADADMGDGVSNITGTLDITVVGGQAVSLAVSAGTPAEQP